MGGLSRTFFSHEGGTSSTYDSSEPVRPSAAPRPPEVPPETGMGRLWHIEDNFAPPGSTGRQRARPVISLTTVIAIGRALTEHSGTRSAIVYCGHHMIDQNEESVVGRSSPPHAGNDEEDDEPHEQAGPRGTQDTENFLHAEHYQGFATCVGTLGTVSLTPSVRQL